MTDDEDRQDPSGPDAHPPLPPDDPAAALPGDRDASAEQPEADDAGPSAADVDEQLRQAAGRLPDEEAFAALSAEILFAQAVAWRMSAERVQRDVELMNSFLDAHRTEFDRPRGPTFEEVKSRVLGHVWRRRVPVETLSDGQRRALCRSARRSEHIDQYRSATRRRQVGLSEAEALSCDRTPDPSTEPIACEERGRLDRMLATALTEPQLEVFERWLDGQSHDEIGATTQRSPSAVSSMLCRGKQALLGSDDADDPDREDGEDDSD